VQDLTLSLPSLVFNLFNCNLLLRRLLLLLGFGRGSLATLLSVRAAMLGVLLIEVVQSVYVRVGTRSERLAVVGRPRPPLASRLAVGLSSR